MKGSASYWLHKAAEVGGKVATTAVHLSTSTSALGKASAVLGIAHAFLGDAPSLIDTYAEHDSLALPDAVNMAVLKVLVEHGHARTGRKTAGQHELLLVHGGLRVAWIKQDHTIAGPYFREEDKDAASALLGRLLWESLGTRLRVAVRGWRTIELGPDSLGGDEAAPDEDTVALHEQLKAFNGSGHHRAVLFHGQPGTGKSYRMRQLAALRGGYSVRHKTSPWTEDYLPSLVELLRPRTMLIDDIDRAVTSSMLDAIESIKRSTPVVLISANYTESLDPAIRRPGRFDMSIEVKSSPELLRKVAGEVAQDVLDRLLLLPVAYVHEFALTRQVCGDEAALARLGELELLAAEIASAEAPEVRGEVKSA